MKYCPLANTVHCGEDCAWYIEYVPVSNYDGEICRYDCNGCAIKVLAEHVVMLRELKELEDNK